MSLEQAGLFIQTIRKDEALRGRVLEKEPAEVEAIARELGFDATSDELLQTANEVRRNQISSELPAELTQEELDQIAGGFWNETGPDGHELDCWITYHGMYWQVQHKIYCKSAAYCESNNYTITDLSE